MRGFHFFLGRRGRCGVVAGGVGVVVGAVVVGPMLRVTDVAAGAIYADGLRALVAVAEVIAAEAGDFLAVAADVDEGFLLCALATFAS